MIRASLWEDHGDAQNYFICSIKSLLTMSGNYATLSEHTQLQEKDAKLQEKDAYIAELKAQLAKK